MLIEWLLTPIFLLVSKGFELVNLDQISLPGWLGDTLNLLSYAMMFFPVDVWVVVIANIAIWLTAQFGWAIFEWTYKKIPGID